MNKLRPGNKQNNTPLCGSYVSADLLNRADKGTGMRQCFFGDNIIETEGRCRHTYGADTLYAYERVFPVVGSPRLGASSTRCDFFCTCTYVFFPWIDIKVVFSSVSPNILMLRSVPLSCSFRAKRPSKKACRRRNCDGPGASQDRQGRTGRSGGI